MYSTITIFCPKCGTGQDVRVKSGMFTLSSAPLSVLAELDGNHYTCIGCDYRMQIVVQRIVTVE